ncbi:hypothetical protein HPB50_004209 [Hyalomma asiaticum]|uniref:Uncharacterized protein n=1 Tax=Hyalomma asiaticum TaxID=266040 RepID=A0ACB7SSY0_HYAAI|nr:hypothetical protein HPB50_004209 [Hyalomma asiaticum]
MCAWSTLSPGPLPQSPSRAVSHELGHKLKHARCDTTPTIVTQRESPRQPLATPNSRNFRETFNLLAADPGPDPGVALVAIQGVHRGPGAVLGSVPAVRDARPPPEVHRGAPPGPVPGPTVNDRRARRHYRRHTMPTRISEAHSLGRTPPREKQTLHHRKGRVYSQSKNNTHTTSEIAFLKRENAMMKETIQKLTAAIAELKNARSVCAATPTTDNATNAVASSLLQPVGAGKDEGASAAKKRAVVRDEPTSKPELDDLKSTFSAIKESLRFLGESMALMQSTLATHRNRLGRIEHYLDHVVAPAVAAESVVQLKRDACPGTIFCCNTLTFLVVLFVLGVLKLAKFIDRPSIQASFLSHSD